MKKSKIVSADFEKIVGGGQAMATLEDGRKLFAWGILPGEKAEVLITKKKSKYLEGLVDSVLKPSPDRISPVDANSYLSTSPWQIMTFETEQIHKSELIKDAFRLHNINLDSTEDIYSDGKIYEYRNKVEFSFWWDKEKERLDLAFFKRGSHAKIPVEGTSLAMPAINQAAKRLLEILRTRQIEAYSLKTMLIRAGQDNQIVVQLYVKDEDIQELDESELKYLNVRGFELIFSNPKSPASVITKRLQKAGEATLSDKILGNLFRYPGESFFQINIPVYETALSDMKKFINRDQKVVDLYSGVGSIGLSVTDGPLTLIEINESAVVEARRTILDLNRSQAEAVLSASESALQHIESDSIVIVDPPRAGLHNNVVERLLESRPPRIIYLSCNPVTQARDIALLKDIYDIEYSKGYNFFPRTPHIEHLVVLDRAKQADS